MNVLNIENVTIEIEDDLSSFICYIDGQEEGHGSFGIDGYIYPESVELNTCLRGKGVYFAIVDFIIKNMESIDVYEFRSIQRSEMANKFWQKYSNVSAYNKRDHKNGSQEQIIIDSKWRIDYR